MVITSRAFGLLVCILAAEFAAMAYGEDMSQQKAAKACDYLRFELGQDIVQTVGEDYYAKAMANPYSLFNTVYRPACVVVPTTTSHVQSAMKAIYRGQVRYAVQAGGHTGMTGWNNVQDGVLIFFAKMNNVTYDKTTNRATLGPGVRWEDALAALEPYGVAPMGGRLGHIGTGLLLGGGVSYLASEHGWSSDAIREMDVVLVNGDQVTATRTNAYSDLFRALKGGGSRFGIVTRFEVEPVVVGRQTDKNWFGGLILYPESSGEALIRATQRFVQNTKDPKIALLVVMGYVMQAGTPVAMHTVSLFYRGSALPPSIFGDFLNTPSTYQFLAPMSYLEVANIFGSGDYRDSGERFTGSGFSGGVEQYLKAFRDWELYAKESANALNSTVFAFTPILESQIRVSRDSGGNAITPPMKPYASVHWLNTYIAGALQVPAVAEHSLDWLMNSNPPSPGTPIDMNESQASQNVYATYGDYGFVKRVYAKYDPTSVKYSDGPLGL